MHTRQLRVRVGCRKVRRPMKGPRKGRINDLEQRVKVQEVQLASRTAKEKVRRLEAEAEARAAKLENTRLKSIDKLGVSVGGLSLDY
jgi:hypothetical protein